MLRHDAKHRRAVSGRLPIMGNAEVVGASDAAADAFAAGVLQPGEICRAECHREVERRIGEYKRLPETISGIEPAVQNLDHALAQDRRLKNAAVEQDGSRYARGRAIPRQL